MRFSVASHEQIYCFVFKYPGRQVKCVQCLLVCACAPLGLSISMQAFVHVSKWMCSCGLYEHSRFKVLIQENVIPVELKAVFVIYNDLLYTLQAADKNVIHLFKQGFYCLPAMFCSQVSSKVLHLPLTSLFEKREARICWRWYISQSLTQICSNMIC